MTAARLVEIDTPLGPAHAHVSRPPRARGTVVLTHGASGRLSGADLLAARDGLVGAGWAVAFVQQAWGVAGRRMPPRPVPQDEAWLPIVETLRSGRGKLPGPLVLSGKSNGARVACRTAANLGADGVLCLSFPLHPPGKPEVSRADELRLPVAAEIPLHVIQGERDPFGTPGEVRAELADPAYVTAVKGEHTIRATGPLAEAAVAFVESLL
ncbi:alpha/beta family hydrolase [Knoellia subterranea]|uniref:Alpha/beta hydrolase n=1 Tax=Knoellia subterranea KCTC 19937 TaxID=1385521 RepID=A0A0A0JRM0_9MICO|nr:alpha/beta family hydrolase [Knoellia subterranea]KGN39359.1 alpha/beta hydrolase [Knoellia subterranea KCTC 19937]